MNVSRRTVLAVSAAAAAAGAVSRPAFAASGARPLHADPFTLGVASGDPDHEGFVLWTRLAPEPLAEDGLGGMPNRPVVVDWQVATDRRFRHVIREGFEIADPRSAHSVHVELDGLPSDGEYFYRFRAERHLSPIGRTRTAPAPSILGGSLAMGVVSCSQYEHGYFTAYRRLAEENPDLILHLGDYMYEYTKNHYVIPGGNVRHHDGPETVTLANYRQRYAQYKTDPDLQAAHAAAPWAVVWDDHELDNNYADEVYERPENPQPDFLARRAAAYKAYYENMPLRRTSVPRDIDLQLYRRIRWGKLANFHMLDTRQYRDDQACGDGYKECPEADSPDRSIMGKEQERWLIDGFRRSEARWDFLGQQVFFGHRDRDPNEPEVVSMDSWDGYAASRDRITRGWVNARVRNLVVLTGDVHAHWAGDLRLDYKDPESPTVGAELVGSSITSGGDGRDAPSNSHPWLGHNPQLHFQNNQRGYVMTTITSDQMSADFKVLPYVRTAGAESYTRATFVVEDKRPGLIKTYDRPVDPGTATASDADRDRETVRLETERP